MSKKENRILLTEEETQSKFFEGAEELFKKVATTYGPRGKNVAIEQSFGRPVFTRDGVTVSRAVFFSDRAKNMGAQMLNEAAETTNRIAGDGTSATTVLAYNLLKNSQLSVRAGEHPMDISRQLRKDSDTLLEKLEELTTPVKKGQLKNVATVSSGDALLGQLISEAIEYVGEDGGVIAEKAPVNDVEREYVDGYYIQSGFTALQAGKKEMTDPVVVVSHRTLRARSDVFELLTATAQAAGIQPNSGQLLKLFFIGNIEGDAYTSLVDAINRGVLDAIIVTPPPSFGSMAKELLEDIAIYTHCRPVTEEVNMRSFDASFLGTASRVVATKTETTIFGDGAPEDIDKRIADIREAIESEVSDLVIERLKDRVAKLEGKIALFKIGAPTDSAKEELEFRVEDAINATRAAAQKGIVPGGGVTLLELSKLEDISEVTRKSLRDTFRQLLINANLPSEIKLAEALTAPFGHGFNLRKDDKLIDLLKEGVIDPRLVTEQTIINATDVVANGIIAGGSIIFENTDD